MRKRNTRTTQEWPGIGDARREVTHDIRDFDEESIVCLQREQRFGAATVLCDAQGCTESFKLCQSSRTALVTFSKQKRC